jgi:hypothetical protein
MSYNEVYIAERIMDNQVQQNVQEADTRRLIRELKTNRQGWFLRAACRLGQGLAHWMIGLGQKLEQATLPPGRPIQQG